MRTADAVPGSIRLAGGLVAAQGLAGLGFGVALLVRAIDGGSTPGNNLYGQAGYFGVLFGAVLGCGIGLLLGRRGVRVPAIVINILLTVFTVVSPAILPPPPNPFPQAAP